MVAAIHFGHVFVLGHLSLYCTIPKMHTKKKAVGETKHAKPRIPNTTKLWSLNKNLQCKKTWENFCHRQFQSFQLNSTLPSSQALRVWPCQNISRKISRIFFWKIKKNINNLFWLSLSLIIRLHNFRKINQFQGFYCIFFSVSRSIQTAGGALWDVDNFLVLPNFRGGVCATFARYIVF